MNIFSKLLDIAKNIAPINIPVIACMKPIGFIILNIQEDTVIAVDIATMAITKFIPSFLASNPTCFNTV